MQQFNGFNLIMESPIEVPGAVPVLAPVKAPDLRIEIGVAEPVEASAFLSVYGAEILYSVPGTAHYRSTRETIGVTVEAGADPDMVAALLIATAIPASLWHRDKLLLHAATVVPHDCVRALAIAGPRGVGKSTLASSFIASGAALVSDDCLAIDFNGREALASGLPGGLFRQSAGDRDRRFDVIPTKRQMTRAPLGAIVVLSNDYDRRLLTRLDPINAIEAVLANCHRARIPALLGRQREMLVQAAKLVRGVAIFQWHRRSPDTNLHADELAMISDIIGRA